MTRKHYFWVGYGKDPLTGEIVDSTFPEGALPPPPPLNGTYSWLRPLDEISINSGNYGQLREIENRGWRVTLGLRMFLTDESIYRELVHLGTYTIGSPVEPLNRSGGNDGFMMLAREEYDSLGWFARLSKSILNDEVLWVPELHDPIDSQESEQVTSVETNLVNRFEGAVWVAASVEEFTWRLWMDMMIDRHVNYGEPLDDRARTYLDEFREKMS